MLRRDWLMDQIEMFAAALARIIFNRNIRNYDQARIEIDNVLSGMLRLDPVQVRQLSDQELIALLRKDEKTQADKALILAEVLYEEAEITEDESGFDDRVYALYCKIFCLYTEAFISDNRLLRSKYLAKTELLPGILAEQEPPLHVKYYLFRYYELTNNLARAEDTLYELLDADYPDMPAQGRAFYLRLMDKSDTELANGNLPRNEVEDGLAQMEKRLRKK